MLCSQVQILLVALCWSVVLEQVGGAPHRDTLTETLRAELTSDKEEPRLLLMNFVSGAVAARGEEMLRRLEEVEEEEVAAAAAGGREEVMRRQLSLSQRERKAGCRNFFWKTFTSC